MVSDGFWSWQWVCGVSGLARFQWIVVVCWISTVDCGCLVDFCRFEWVSSLVIVGLCLCFPICCGLWVKIVGLCFCWLFGSSSYRSFTLVMVVVVS